MGFIKEECLELKKAVFYSDKIILHKIKGDITIGINEIDHLDYAMPTFYNYVFSSGAIYPGRLAIWLKVPHVGKRSCYLVKMKHIDYLRLPFNLKQRVNYKA